VETQTWMCIVHTDHISIKITSGGKKMGAVTILLGIAICVFLCWFFESILKDFTADECGDSEHNEVYIDLRK